ncbi:PADI2 deiminase, partial [Smithornis capensis]|nr:PADI2 deiminase [Smithornis capensis]
AAPAGAVSFGVKHTEGVSVDVVSREGAEGQCVPSSGTRWPLQEGTGLRLSMSQVSSEANDNKVRNGIMWSLHGWRTSFPNPGFGGLQVTVSFYGEEGKPINQAGVFLTGIGISLDVDADQDGVVERNSPNKASWTWGPEGHGAILLVSCDRDIP